MNIRLPSILFICFLETANDLCTCKKVSVGKDATKSDIFSLMVTVSFKLTTLV